MFFNFVFYIVLNFQNFQALYWIRVKLKKSKKICKSTDQLKKIIVENSSCRHVKTQDSYITSRIEKSSLKFWRVKFICNLLSRVKKYANPLTSQNVSVKRNSFPRISKRKQERFTLSFSTSSCIFRKIIFMKLKKQDLFKKLKNFLVWLFKSEFSSGKQQKQTLTVQ